MRISSKGERFLLFLGDIAVFLLSLWLMLIIRYQHLPTHQLISDHLRAFSVLFVVWVIVFFIAGLYEKPTFFFRNRLPTTLLNAQIVNSVLAVLFFYFIPYFGITPKTNLFIYLVISFLLLLVWRMYIVRLFGFRKKQMAILAGSGQEMKELYEEVNNNSHYPLQFVSVIDLAAGPQPDLEQQVMRSVREQGATILVIDLKDEQVGKVLAQLYNLIFSHVYFVDIHKVYEDIFDRVPLSLINHSWFLENISLAPKTGYDIFKRAIDVILSFILGIVSLILYPFIWLAIKIDDGGSLFVKQKRVGQNDKIITIYKFRSMAFNDGGDQNEVAKNHITRVGKFTRKTRLDELPQLWNVLFGELSLIGPRSELPALVEGYEKEIMYYRVRHLIKPGLSGWAQLYHKDPPKVHADAAKTRNKLSYDLYYIKNRSFLLDISIALKTLKVFLSRSGV